MRTISIDIETYSCCDLSKCGVYKYTESPDFKILLFGYSVDGGEVQVIDLAAGETLPPEILDALTDDTVQKWAFNANFERVCLSRYLRDMGVSLDPFADNHHSATVLGKAKYLNPESWRCSMVWSAYMGLPLSLEGAGAVLGIEKQKLTVGKELVRYFCSPCKPTAANGQRTRNHPEHAPNKWAAFKAYNKRDVEAEMSIQERLTKFPVPDSIWTEYCQDQEINDRGVMLDMDLVRRAIEADARSKAELTRLMKEITDLDNPNSVAQMKEWLCDNGLETDTLGKKAVAELIKTAPEPLGEALSLRQQLAKSSVKKYQAMENAVCADGRARGMFQFYGANRTGRWAGRLIQMQNLPQNHLPDLEQARELVKRGDFAALELLYDSVPEVLSELIRTAFVPKVGCKLVVADFSAIEARVIAWLAGEHWRNEVFATHGKIYEASASQMFRVPIEEVTKGSPLRQKSKIAELALGYGGSVGALKAMGALDMGLTEDELQPLVTAWRAANPNIVRLWWDVDRAAMTAVRDRTLTETHGIKFGYMSGMLFITLPSGRRLSYVKPRIGTNRFGSDCVTYEGVGGTKKWERLDSYGPKFVENCLSADTEVLTQRGWLKITDIRAADRLWDGDKWVSHSGLVCKGQQQTIEVEGIRMTPDHKILMKGGWSNASSYTEYNRRVPRLPYSHRICGFQRQEVLVGSSMHLRQCENMAGETLSRKQKLRLHEGRIYKRITPDSWDEQASCLSGMALNDRPLQSVDASCVEELWCQRHHGMQTLASRIREFLGGHGRLISARSDIRQNQQRRELRARKLPLGDIHQTSTKSTQQHSGRDSFGCHDRGRGCGQNSNWKNNSVLQNHSPMPTRLTVYGAGFYESVYDILNAGDEHRFVVRGKTGVPLIVHNCVQAISRDILCFAMQTQRCCDIVMHVHDEIVVEADPRMSTKVLCEQMSRTPPWANGLLLRADGYECGFYKKD